jgi:hypothetical protein
MPVFVIKAPKPSLTLARIISEHIGMPAEIWLYILQKKRELEEAGLHFPTGDNMGLNIHQLRSGTKYVSPGSLDTFNISHLHFDTCLKTFSGLYQGAMEGVTESSSAFHRVIYDRFLRFREYLRQWYPFVGFNAQKNESYYRLLQTILELCSRLSTELRELEGSSIYKTRCIQISEEFELFHNYYFTDNIELGRRFEKYIYRAFYNKQGPIVLNKVYQFIGKFP